MKRFTAILAALMITILAILPMSMASAESTRMYVSASNGKNVRLRSLPTTDAEIVTNFNVGRPVEVMGTCRDGEWSEVRVQVNGKYVYGYMMSQFLSANDPATKTQHFTDVKNTFTVKVRPASAHGIVSMWSRPSKRNIDKVRDLDKNETMTVISESNAWYIVSASDGELGYVAKAYVNQ